jgi:hypothetical protein
VCDLPSGYPQLAAYLNSDPDFTIFRRFGFLQNRLLLYRQAELEALQLELHHLDRDDDEKDRNPRFPENPRLYWWQWDTNHPETQSRISIRVRLMDKIEEKLMKYSKTLLLTHPAPLYVNILLT